MCSAPKIAAPAPVTPPPAPQQAQKGVQEAVAKQTRKAAGAKGVQSTLLTGPQGLQGQAQTQKKTLLGQ